MAYRELFVHSAVIQAAGKGLLIGRFVDNRLASGVKYAAGLTGVTLVAFLVFVWVGSKLRITSNHRPTFLIFK